MADFRDDVPLDMRLAGRRDPDRLVIFDVNGRCAPGDYLSVAGNDVRRAYPVTQFGDLTIDCDDARLDQPIRLTPGTEALFCEKFVDADCGGHRRSV